MNLAPCAWTIGVRATPVFGATTGGEVYCGEANGERWTLIASDLAPISKKGHERLLAAS